MDLDSILEVNIKTNGSLDKYFNYSIPTNKTFKEIEDERETMFKEMVQILVECKNCLTPYLKAKTGVNTRQLAQSIFNVGYKSDLNRKVISHPIDTNFLTGLKSSKDYYVNAKGARKSLIINHREVKAAGYSTRKLSLLCIDSNLNTEASKNYKEDCGSTNYLRYTIETEKEFNRFIGRVAKFVEDIDDMDSWIIIEATDFEELKGRTLDIRTPITCHSHANGDGICKTCFGDALYELNRKYNVGLIGVNFLTSQLTQGLLSNKHLSTVNTESLDWTEVQQFFDVHANMLVVKDTLLDFNLHIELEEEDKEFNKIKLIKNDKLMHEITLPVSVSLFDTSFEPVIDNGIMIIESSKLSYNTELFTYSADNREMSKSLKDVQKLMERKNKEGIDNAHQLTKELITALNESGIVLNSVYLEIIIFNLMKNRGKDFINEKHDLTEIMGMSEALQNSATSISLSFERLKDQLKNINFYNNTRTSVYDIFYQ